MQLKITFAAGQDDLARRIQTDLAQSHLRLDHSYRVVLVTPALVNDATIMDEIAAARQSGMRIVPVIIENADFPAGPGDLPPVDMTGKYKRDALIAAIRRDDIGATVRGRNRRLFAWVGVVAVVIFAVGLVSIGSGTVRVPVNEFATENAVQQQMIATFQYPTLEGLMPRSTQEAQGFPATVEAASTRDFVGLVTTATAQAAQIQATQQVIATAAAQTMTAEPE